MPPADCLARQVKRHFYHLRVGKSAEDSWWQFADHHRFRLFWAPFDKLLEIVHPQNEWLDFVTKRLNYSLSSG